MNAGFFNMFHDTSNKDLIAVMQRIHIHLNRIFQELVNQHWVAAGYTHCITHIFVQISHLPDYFHGASTEHI